MSGIAVLGHNGIAVGHFSFCFSALGLRRSLAPNGAERLFLLALDLLFGRSVLALQLEMLLDRIIEYAHRAEPYRGRLDGYGSAIRGAADGAEGRLDPVLACALGAVESGVRGRHQRLALGFRSAARRPLRSSP